MPWHVVKMEDKITLDRESFKALSVDTRVNVLKSLYERRKTLSELSSALELRNSTVKEHMEVLLKAGLVKKIDEGYKWKYYALTMKGKNIVNPTEIKVLITLAVSSLLLLGTTALFLSRLFSFQFLPQAFEAAQPLQAPEMGAAESAADAARKAAEEATMGIPEDVASPTPVLTPIQAARFVPLPELSLILILALIVGSCIGYLMRRKI